MSSGSALNSQDLAILIIILRDFDDISAWCNVFFIMWGLRIIPIT